MRSQRWPCPSRFDAVSRVIYIDADACPVKDETVQVARRHSLPVYIVSNGNPSASGPTRADCDCSRRPRCCRQWIADRASDGDVVVTADIPLAARVIASGAAALRHNGDVQRREYWLTAATRDQWLICGLRIH